MEVILTGNAAKQYNRLNEPIASRIANAINGLKEENPQGDIKPIKGEPGTLRLRVGDYRILFYEENNCRYVFKIAPRGDVYRGKK